MPTSETTTSSSLLSLSELNDETLQSLRQRIIDSGVLGRSPVYQQLLDYLLDSAKSGKQPKEFEIAIDVLGRDSNFDVSKDSVVRVYIHQLRKRLDEYFSRIDPQSAHRLSIPKGQYTIKLSVAAASASTSARPFHLASSWQVLLPLILICTLLLVGNIWQWQQSRSTTPDSQAQHVLQSPLWQSLVDDELPILVVMGDYYIFGETDNNGRVTRMIRDFSINSREDLAEQFMQDNSLQQQFRDLDMNYLPEGSARALMQIAPIIAATGKRTEIRMMSRISTADLRNRHVIYIGYISAMDKLSNMYFPSSGLTPGRTYDELYNKEQQTFYTSTAGLPAHGQAFRDLALIATWPAANGNQFILISGTRDAGLMHAANVVANTNDLQTLTQAMANFAQESGPSYEALYEVFGMDRMDFDAGLLYHQALDPERVWHR